MVGDPPSHSYYCGDDGSGSGGGTADAARHLRSAAELRTAQHRTADSKHLARKAQDFCSQPAQDFCRQPATITTTIILTFDSQ